MATIIVFCAQYLFLAEGVLGLYIFWKAKGTDRRTLVLRGLVVLLVAVVLAKLAGFFYFDQRPFVRLHVAPLVAHVADNGFPSDHTLLSFGIALLILPYSKRLGLLAILIAAFVAWGRVASLLHSPLDVAASILFAAIANAIAWLAVRERRQRPTPP